MLCSHFLRPTRDWFRAIWPPKTTTLIRLHRVVKNDDDAGARWFMILICVKRGSARIKYVPMRPKGNIAKRGRKLIAAPRLWDVAQLSISQLVVGYFFWLEHGIRLCPEYL